MFSQEDQTKLKIGKPALTMQENAMTHCILFAAISKEQQKIMLNCLGANRIKFKRNKTILEQGDRVENIGVVLFGTVQIFRVDYEGNRSIIMHLNPGDVFGESFACAEVSEIPVSVVALTDCEILMMNCRRILRCCSNACDFHRQLISNLLKNIALKNLVIQEKIEIISKRTTRDKLLTYLNLEAKKRKKLDFEIAFNRQELADYLEVDRSGLSSEISKLVKEKIIACTRNHFCLL